MAGSTDRDGRPRVQGARVDMGAYEYQGPGTGEFIGWLQSFTLPTDGSADFLDSDGDGFTNWQEYRCGTAPTNALSALRLLPPARVGRDLVLTWPSASNRVYDLYRLGALAESPLYVRVATNLVGQLGTTTFTLTNGAAAPLRFFRVGVE